MVLAVGVASSLGCIWRKFKLLRLVFGYPRIVSDNPAPLCAMLLLWRNRHFDTHFREARVITGSFVNMVFFRVCRHVT